MKFSDSNYLIEFSKKEFDSMPYLPIEVYVQQVSKGIWKITPDDRLNDHELEKEFWNCKFLQASLHYAQILISLKEAVKKHSVNPEESFIKVTDNEKIFTSTFFLQADNIKQLQEKLMDFYKDVNEKLQRTPTDTARIFECN